MPLTDTKVKNAKPSEKAVKLTNGFDLYFLVHPNGSKYWKLGYRFKVKLKVFSIGVYPAVSLADARQRRDEAKKLLAYGIDHSAKKQADNKTTLEKLNNSRASKPKPNQVCHQITCSEDYQCLLWIPSKLTCSLISATKYRRAGYGRFTDSHQEKLNSRFP